MLMRKQFKSVCVCVGPQIGMSPILVWGLPDLEY
jgi:hypothetical protein